MNHKGVEKYPGLLSGTAAFLAGTMEQILHPFEVLKFRLQSHDGRKVGNIVPKYDGVIKGLKDLFQNEGIRGMYRGVVITAVSSNIAKFIFFTIFAHQKHYYEQFYGKDATKAVMLGSIQGSISSAILTSPLWVIKTRMLLSTETSASKGLRNYNFVINQIYKQHGVPGFFRGLHIAILNSTHGMINITLYETFKWLLGYYEGNNPALPAISGVASKFITSLLLYPLNVIKTRIQQNQYIEGNAKKYDGLIDVVKKTAKLEGFGGFYKGFIPSTIRSVPSNAVFYFFLEYYIRLLQSTGLF